MDPLLLTQHRNSSLSSQTTSNGLGFTGVYLPIINLDIVDPQGAVREQFKTRVLKNRKRMFCYFLNKCLCYVLDLKDLKSSAFEDLPQVWPWCCFGTRWPQVQGWPGRDSEGTLVYSHLKSCPEALLPTQGQLWTHTHTDSLKLRYSFFMMWELLSILKNMHGFLRTVATNANILHY